MARSDFLSSRLSRSTLISWWPRCFYLDPHLDRSRLSLLRPRRTSPSHLTTLCSTIGSERDYWRGLFLRCIFFAILSNSADWSSSGKKWKTHRRIITPSFHDNNLLANCIDTFNEQLQACLRHFQTLAEQGTEVNLYRWISAWTLDVICGQSFWRAATISTRSAISVRSRNSDGKEYRRARKRIGIWQCRSSVGSSQCDRMRHHLVVG